MRPSLAQYPFVHNGRGADAPLGMRDHLTVDSRSSQDSGSDVAYIRSRCRAASGAHSRPADPDGHTCSLDDAVAAHFGRYEPPHCNGGTLAASGHLANIEIAAY